MFDEQLHGSRCFCHPFKHNFRLFRIEYVSRMYLFAPMFIKRYSINTALDPSKEQQMVLAANVSIVCLGTCSMIHGFAAQCCPEKCPCRCLGMVMLFWAIWLASDRGKKTCFKRDISQLFLLYFTSCSGGSDFSSTRFDLCGHGSCGRNQAGRWEPAHSIADEIQGICISTSIWWKWLGITSSGVSPLYYLLS